MSARQAASRLLVIAFISGSQFMTFIGLTGQLRMADDPRYSSLSTDLLRPWLTWCPLVNNQASSCYGTSWAHWGGPYSILWYWTNAALSLNGFLPYTFILYAVNLLIQSRLGTSWLGPLFSINCLFCLLGWPQNMIVLWLIFLGFYHRIGLVLAPLFKLPIGAFGSTGYVWSIALGRTGTGIGDPGNYFTYFWLVAMWLGAFSYLFRAKLLGPVRHLTGKKEEDHGEDESDNQIRTHQGVQP